MSLLAELCAILGGLGVPAETGVFSGVPPDTYAVLTPLTDAFAVYADDTPQGETQEVRVSLFCKGSYRATAKALASALLSAGITITGRRYAGYEHDTGYHNYAVDTAKYYGLQEGE
jgi:hypothetical protein